MSDLSISHLEPTAFSKPDSLLMALPHRVESVTMLNVITALLCSNVQVVRLCAMVQHSITVNYMEAKLIVNIVNLLYIW
jgi:hypothetical protein